VTKYRNTLLGHLSPEIIARLALVPVSLELLHELEFPGASIDHLFFVEAGVASMTTSFIDGSQVEVTLFGFESVIGVSALMGTKRSLNRIYTQIAGRGFSSPIRAAAEEFKRGGEFQALCLRYVQAQLLQAMQSAACNARHTVDQRLSRWLLVCADRAGTTELKVSQEFLSYMLGTARPTVTLAAAAMREAGLIDYSRGTIRILDMARLEACSCECYRVIKRHLDNYAEFDLGYIA
jgi:CRP-like cAMP-binding protein